MVVNRQKILASLTDRWQSKLCGAACYILSFIYLELVLHAVVFGGVSARWIYPTLFAAVAGGICWAVIALLPEKIGKWLTAAAVALACICFEVQLIYHCVFGSFMPVYQLTMGTAAVTNFSGQILHAIVQNFGKVLALLVPIPVVTVLLVKGVVKARRAEVIQSGALLLAALCLLGVTVGGMKLAGTDNGSAYAILTDNNASTETSVKSLGLIATTVQELRGFFRADTGEENPVFESSGLVELPREDEETESDYNAVGLDFSALETEDEAIGALNQYLATVAPTAKNEYTGIAEGYNLITICAESFSPLLIDEELTPVLYQLSTNGFVFQNFYNSFVNTTTNGEFAFCTGLMPNMSRTKVDSNFDAVNTNYLPYCLGNVYGASGYRAYAYHNYYGTFYNRTVSHVNMGYDFKAIGSGLEMEVQWPSSDLTMMEISVGDYVGSEEPFHAYYMTFSGHYQYSWGNPMSAKNRAAVEHLPYSETVKAYIACNLELEYALQTLMAELEATGQAERTVIVLTGDHYPYGLTEAEYNELAGRPVDTTFERFHNSFICYVPGMEPVEVDAYCSTIDILPTVLNLLGIGYDSRLLAGRDVLAEGVHVAILSDRSFLTEEFRFDASLGTVTDHNGQPVEDAPVDDYRAYVDSVFTFSNAVTDTNYYSYVFGGRSVFEEKAIIDFTDVTDIYMEAAIRFAVENGFIQPDSNTVFGTDRTTTVSELVEAFYGMEDLAADDPKRMYALSWAMRAGIVTGSGEWDEELTYGKTAQIIYRYLRSFKGAEAPAEEDLAALCIAYPDLPAEGLEALKHCNDVGIIRGPSGDKTIFDRYDRTVNRGQLASYIQRVFEY